MSDKKLIVKDAVTENEVVSKFSEFIGRDDFSSLASCATIVGLLTEFAKAMNTGIHPIVISLIFSTIISGIKLMLSGDYNKDNIILSIINIIPIALTASGGYDIIKTVTAG